MPANHKSPASPIRRVGVGLWAVAVDESTPSSLALAGLFILSLSLLKLKLLFTFPPSRDIISPKLREGTFDNFNELSALNIPRSFLFFLFSMPALFSARDWLQSEAAET